MTSSARRSGAAEERDLARVGLQRRLDLGAIAGGLSVKRLDHACPAAALEHPRIGRIAATGRIREFIT